MGKIMRRSIYVAGALALFAVLATGTEYYNSIIETGRLTLKGQREVFNQRELYREIEESERAKYNDSWFQLTVDPGYADNNPKDGIISLLEKKGLWIKAGAYNSIKGNPVAGMNLFPDGTPVFPPLTSENLETAIEAYKEAAMEKN